MANGARFLNDNGPVLGLNAFDLIGAMAILVVTSELLRPVHLEFLSIPAAIAALVALIPIRLRYRRRIIRDSVGFFIGARHFHDVRRSQYASRR